MNQSEDYTVTRQQEDNATSLSKPDTVQQQTGPRQLHWWHTLRQRSHNIEACQTLIRQIALVTDDEMSAMSPEVNHKRSITPIQSDRQRRQCYQSCETSHHGQHSRSRYRHNRHSQEQRRDTYDSDSHHGDRDSDRYRDRRSSLVGRKPCYEPRQRRRHSPSVVRDRYRGRGRPRRSRSHTNSYDDSRARLRCSDNDVCNRRNHEPPIRNITPGNGRPPRNVPPKKRVSVYNLPTGVDSILLPQTTSISTTSVASPNTARTLVTEIDSSRRHCACTGVIPWAKRPLGVIRPRPPSYLPNE